jgi:uncharacterized protein (TIGR01244 family)
MKKHTGVLTLAGFLLLGECFMPKVITTPTLTAQDLAHDNFHTVQEGRLYRSGQIPRARIAAYLQEYGIKTIINLRGKAENAMCCWGEKGAAKSCAASVIHIPMRAGKMSTPQEINELLAAFDKAQEPLLIHCSQGINRTGEACALWLLEKCGATNAQALEMFDAKYGYNRVSRPEKYQLIESWQTSSKE